jgi:hypothetical protein
MLHPHACNLCQLALFSSKLEHFARLILLDFSLNLRSSLLLIAMVQGVLVALLLLRRGARQGRIQDYFLAGLLAFLAFSLIEHFLGFMGVYDHMREAGHDLTFFPCPAF